MKKKKIYPKTNLKDVVNALNVLIDPALEIEEKEGFQAEALIAQACLETGWLKHIISIKDENTGKVISSNNLFNIKAGLNWKGEKICKQVLEYNKKGEKYLEESCFRKYKDYKESFEDYVNLIKNNKRYEKAYQSRFDVPTYLKELQKAGYATDPDYANKILKIIRKYIGVELVDVEEKKE